MCPEASEFLDVPFGDVARAFGAYGERVTTPEEFIPALRRAEESGKPAIVDVAEPRASSSSNQIRGRRLTQNLKTRCAIISGARLVREHCGVGDVRIP